MSFKKKSCVYMSYKKKLCVYVSFNIKRHIYTSVISWCWNLLEYENLEVNQSSFMDPSKRFFSCSGNDISGFVRLLVLLTILIERIPQPRGSSLFVGCEVKIAENKNPPWTTPNFFHEIGVVLRSGLSTFGLFIWDRKWNLHGEGGFFRSIW